MDAKKHMDNDSEQPESDIVLLSPDTLNSVIVLDDSIDQTLSDFTRLRKPDVPMHSAKFLEHTDLSRK